MCGNAIYLAILIIIMSLLNYIYISITISILLNKKCIKLTTMVTIYSFNIGINTSIPISI